MAQLEEEEQEAVVVAAPAKRRSPLVIALVVALVALSGAFAYTLVALRGDSGTTATVAGKDGKSVKGTKVTKPALPEFYLPLDPAFVVNFRDDDSLRYLQVGVSLMSHDQAALAVAKEADPVIRDALVMLFSRQDYSILSDPVGKQKLQVEALAAVRKIVAARFGGKPGIDGLYFTSFVMQ
jgi:Flagellar basal body-associated protein